MEYLAYDIRIVIYKIILEQACLGNIDRQAHRPPALFQVTPIPTACMLKHIAVNFHNQLAFLK